LKGIRNVNYTFNI